MLFYFCRARASDEGSTDLEKRSRHDSESSKNKKKHKKHKKHKKAKKHETEDRDRSSSKKHKKHRKNANDDIISGTNSESPTAKHQKATSTIAAGKVDGADNELPPQTTSTLNTKFTEIMKSNGHVVVAKVPTTKFNNGNQPECVKRTTQTNITAKIPTDPNELVAYITKSLDPNIATQVISSASESGSIHDVDSPDVAVIEEDDDLNLEELMRQKALLQARLGKYFFCLFFFLDVDQQICTKFVMKHKFISQVV